MVDVRKRRSITFLTMLFVVTSLSARHIIGGEITYECLGEENYRITMHVYRDCDCNNCATLGAADFAIYLCGKTIACESLTQASPFTTIEDVPPPENPCIIMLPFVCVEEGIYRFEVHLPLSEETYHIVYQRCCRNETITNIINPSDAGATFSVEILPLAQEECNNSPVFNDFPPTVICVNKQLNFDHSATDPDGDQVVYSLCSPLLGGGPIGVGIPGDETQCGGVRPSPPCPPPFDDVPFVFPVYDAQFPMAGNPVVSIDPNTGMINGVPEIRGQFVIGVCATEFRDGELMGSIRRDFQFNVIFCEAIVEAKIEADERPSFNEFVVNSCGGPTVNFVNQSTREVFINEWMWQFEIDSQIQTFPEWNPTVVFPETNREYEGRLFLNPGTECGDSAIIHVRIFPEIQADFSFTIDSCSVSTAAFTDRSFIEAGQISYSWNFGDGDNSTNINPLHEYSFPGEFPVTLTIADTNNCEDSHTQIISYFPIPPIEVIPNSVLGCAPFEVFFDNNSTPINEDYDIIWNFGDGQTDTNFSPGHTFTDTGTFTISLAITSPNGCSADSVFEDWIQVLTSPVADFTFTPERPSNISPTVEFLEQSTNGIAWEWDFGGAGISSEPNPTFTFPDTGLHTIHLIVLHQSGCTDTIVKQLDIIPEVRYFLPNAFTPNADGVNDDFRGNGQLEGIRNFRFTIWSRWGQLLFETNNPNEAWEGRNNNVGEVLPNGVYTYWITFTGPRGKKFERKGFATLIR